jgi:O-antigen ligase
LSTASIPHEPFAGASAPAKARVGVRLDGRIVGTIALWIVVFLGGFVLREPAPYELAMVVVLSGWLLSAPRFSPALAPLLLVVVLFVCGGLLATLMSDDFGEAIMYIAVTGFLALTSVFFAAVTSADPSRLKTIANAYLASALIVALLGIGGYFGALPGSLFTLYGRAKGTFQDPNVFGPFLVLPWTVMLHAVLTRPLSRALLPVAALAVLSFAILLSFSRAAWGLAAFSGLGVYLLVFIVTRDPRGRARLLGFGLAGLVALVAMIVVALSVDSISGMLLQRARLVQDYDTARLGRFARYALGFQMVLDNPFGLGPLQFRNFFPEDEHNTYLKAFTTYGWLGGVAYLALVGFTATRLFPLVFQPRPWQWAAQCVFVVLLGHMLMSVVIDTDRWRHLYLLYGLAWGLIACEYAWRARAAAPAHAGYAQARAEAPGGRP